MPRNNGRIIQNIGFDSTTRKRYLTVRMPLAVMSIASGIALPNERPAVHLRRLVIQDLVEAVGLGLADGHLRLYAGGRVGSREGSKTVTLWLTEAQLLLLATRARVLQMSQAEYLTTLVNRARINSSR